MKKINRLVDETYYMLSESEEYTEAHKASDNIVEKAMCENIFNTLMQYDDSVAYDVEEKLLDALATRERFGFTQGFKYAMRLAKECGIV